jgi:hypothetical protein
MKEGSASLDDFIVSAAAAFEYPLETGWKPPVRAELEINFRRAAGVAEFTLRGRRGAGAFVAAADQRADHYRTLVRRNRSVRRLYARANEDSCGA